MKAIIVRYEKLFNLGNYQNEKVGVEVALEDGDTPAKALEAAKKFVERHSPVEKVSDYALDRARRIIADPDSFTGKQVKEAQAVIEEHEQRQSEDFPF